MASEEQPLNSNNVVKVKETWKQKIYHIKDIITIEPIAACYVMANALSWLATQNLNLDKACRVNMLYGDEVCNALLAKQGNLYLKEELAVQELIAGMESWKNIILTAIPSFLILFIGAWSDRTGKRKICIIIPIFGELLVCLSNILNTYFFYEIPVVVTVFSEAIFPAITGGWITFYMGVFSYVSDVSTKETRTFRIGVTDLCLTTVTPIGLALSGILLKYIGYYGVFFLSSALYIFGIVYGLFYIKDPTPQASENTENEVNESYNLRGLLSTFFDINHVKHTMTVAFKKGPNKRRTKSLLVLILITLIHGTFRGGMISISIFNRRFKWDDSVLGLISNSSKFLSCLATCFARDTIEMYIAAGIETFNATSYAALRSISSKLVTKDELGKMTSVFNLMEVLASTAFTPMYSWIYGLTIHINATTVYYMTTVLTIPNLLIFGWFFIHHKINSRQQRLPNLLDNGTIFVDTDKEINVTVECEIENDKEGQVFDKAS